METPTEDNGELCAKITCAWRLARSEAKYDPDHLFYVNQNIAPAA